MRRWITYILVVNPQWRFPLQPCSDRLLQLSLRTYLDLYSALALAIALALSQFQVQQPNTPSHVSTELLVLDCHGIEADHNSWHQQCLQQLCQPR